MNFIKPPFLEPGDKVAIVSPSAGLPFLFPWVYEQGLERIKDVFHLVPIEFPSARQTPEYLTQNPRAWKKVVVYATGTWLAGSTIATIAAPAGRTLLTGILCFGGIPLTVALIAGIGLVSWELKKNCPHCARSIKEQAQDIFCPAQYV